jgi:hypothetical protein
VGEPGGLKRGVRRARGVGARLAVVRPGATVPKQGRKWGTKSGPRGYSAERRWEFYSNHIQILSNFGSSKKDPPEMEKFETKYVCEEFKEGNNFLHRNIFIFKMYFKLKFRGSNV